MSHYNSKSPGGEKLQAYILSVVRGRGSGPETSISAAELARRASLFAGEKIGRSTVRALIQRLRISHSPICSGQSGFFWPATQEQVFRSTDRELRGPSRKMLKITRIMRADARALFGNQLPLPLQGLDLAGVSVETMGQALQDQRGPK